MGAGPAASFARAAAPPLSTHTPSARHPAKQITTPSGKTTLLQLLAGKYMVGRKDITVLGGAPFFDMVSLVACSADAPPPSRERNGRPTTTAAHDPPLPIPNPPNKTNNRTSPAAAASPT
jgi:hypothetical protein